MLMKRLVVLTGAGMSAESGIPTFRGADGLWENHRIEAVATPEAWHRDPHLVLRFYNERRKKLLQSEPNEGHHILKRLESHFDVQIITQNIDDLHERAGSSKILHLHGALRKARSTADPELVYPIEGWELRWGDRCKKGSQLRPHIVWFGEAVPLIEPAIDLVHTADIVVVVGTSLQVYPAAGLVHEAPMTSKKFLIDPHIPDVRGIAAIHCITKGASEGLAELERILLNAPE
jgi:NAD-dependent deacetylase